MVQRGRGRGRPRKRWVDMVQRLRSYGHDDTRCHMLDTGQGEVETIYIGAAVRCIGIVKTISQVSQCIIKINEESEY